ncbi:MAG: hypothetical protein BWZ08_02514 [candidate division BRC1 bacterium ADurb.BinA292]|nr:MAG: hypothetical protein BWZ08_02514 [candidate division BRC1 bacterium ADurb.BinA292]
MSPDRRPRADPATLHFITSRRAPAKHIRPKPREPGEIAIGLGIVMCARERTDQAPAGFSYLDFQPPLR